MTADPVQDALDAMADATTETEVMDRLWRAHDLGASWQECREAYERYEQQRGQR